MIDPFLLLRIWPELLRDALISLSCQIKVFLLEWIGSSKHAFERVVVLDLSHDHWIHELDDAILVLLSSLFQLLSLFWCQGTCFLCLFNLLNALMNVEQISRFVSSLVTWYAVGALIHVEELLKEFSICWLILGSCHILIEAYPMLRINIISFDVIVHLVLIKHGEGPRLQSDFDEGIITSSIEVQLLLEDLFVASSVNPFLPISRLVLFLVEMELLEELIDFDEVFR